MSFLDKLKESAGKAVSAASVVASKAAVTGKSVAETAVKQTKTAANIGKVKLAIASEEDKLKKCYTELGRIFFRDYEEQSEAVMEEYQPWCDKAAEAKAQIAALNQQLEEIRAENAPEAPADMEPEATEEAEASESDASVETEEEDTSIYADFVEAQPAEVALAYEVDEAPAEEAPAEAPAESDELPEPTVGTLYVDISGQE